MRFLLSLLLCASFAQAALASERIIDVRSRRAITREELAKRIADYDQVVVGEKHSTESVQNFEAWTFARFADRAEPVTFAWEFWNWSEKAKLATAWKRFRRGKIDSMGFIRAVFGEKSSEATYAPLMDAVRKAYARPLATNLTRAEKAPVVTGGLEALDPKLLPKEFELGGEHYLERFKVAMEGHATPEQIANYFAAQCLVDDVAADHLERDRTTGPSFLVIGDFHTRYFDGAWKRLEKRDPRSRRLLVQVNEASDETDWDAVMNDAKYGPIADILVLL